MWGAFICCSYLFQLHWRRSFRDTAVLRRTVCLQWVRFRKLNRETLQPYSKVLCGVTVWFEQQFLNDFCPGGLHDLSPEESCRWFAADVYPSSALLHSYRFFRHTGIRPQIRAALL